MSKLTARMAVLAAGAVCILYSQAWAMEHGQMLKQDGLGAVAPTQVSDAVRGRGVIRAVDVEAGSVTLAHEPIPALGWPAMIMDLPVTDQVDLGGVKAGDTVEFAIVLGSDDVYRIMALKHVP